jgi:hypothetical protein
MKIKPNLKSGVYLAVIILCLITLLLVVSSDDQFKDVKIVYQAF